MLDVITHHGAIILTQRHREHWGAGVDGLNVIVEVKAARALDPVFERQLLTCLKIMDLRRGLSMDLGMATRKAGIRRIAT